jgi:UPF0755 protein
MRVVALIVATLALSSVLIGAVVQRELGHAMRAPIAVQKPQLLRINPGDNATSIARQLEARGWLPHYGLFVLRARLDGVAGRIKAGTYEIAPGDTLATLLKHMVVGASKEFEVTFIEGSRYLDMREVLRGTPRIEYPLAHGDVADPLLHFDRTLGHPEGRFFPATYRYLDGTAASKILARAYRRMEAVLEEEWSRREPDLPYTTAYEALIMASIIEKETGRPEERPAIAGVFVRRLRAGMKLQTDPTVIYGMGEAFDGNLRRADLRRDTPYNTYTRKGLPPTPIAMPGRASIAAALHPAPGKALYFVAKGDGTHAFSATLREHQNAVRRYQLRQ